MEVKSRTHKQKAIDAANDLADAMNSFSNEEDIEAFVTAVHLQHRTLQQSMFKAVLALLVSWAELEGPGRYDGRNEFTILTAKKIIDFLKSEGVVNKNGTRFYVPFI